MVNSMQPNIMDNGFNDCTDLFGLNLQNEKWCDHVATCMTEISFLEITMKLSNHTRYLYLQLYDQLAIYIVSVANGFEFI